MKRTAVGLAWWGVGMAQAAPDAQTAVGGSAVVGSAVVGSAVPVVNALQTIAALALVLALVVVTAWLMRRLGQASMGQGSALKLVAGVPVGQRERVVLVEIADTWLVLGVTSAEVTALHAMPKPDSAQAPVVQSGGMGSAQALAQRLRPRPVPEDATKAAP